MLLGPLTVFLLVEGGLRLFGYGYATAFWLPTRLNGQKVLVPNEKFGWRFFGPALARTPRPAVIPAAKPAPAIRVFVLGESAAFGDPKPEFGLPRVLEVLLRGRLPGAHIEVINAAMTGINSHVILPIARDCARQQSDLWVIYMGNNEVVGPFGSGTVFGPQAPGLALVRAVLALKTTRVGQLLGDTLAGAGRRETARLKWGMGLFLNQQVRHDDPAMQTVYAHFARNLADILKVGRDHGVKTVVSTVASNLRDCAPFASEHRANLGGDQVKQWDQLYTAGIQAETAGRAAQALELFQSAAQIDDHFAALQFRSARCCLALGKLEEARRHFVLARDFDTLRFRADTRINDLIRQSASGREGQGVRLAESESALAHRSTAGLPGEELLYEHVHLTFEGNYWVARTIADQVLELLPAAVARGNGSAEGWLPPAECARRLAWTDWDRYKALRSVMLRINEPPFTGQLDQAQHYQRLQQQMEALLPALAPPALRDTAAQYRTALALAPADWVLHRNLGDLLANLRDLAGAETEYREVLRCLPLDSQAYLQLGLLLLQAGRPGEAVEQFRAGLRLALDPVPLLNGLGLAFAQLGKPDQALEQYAKALKTRPDSVETLLNLGTALQAGGRKEEARERFRDALRQPLETTDALVRLGKVCFAQGWTDAAITNLFKAVRLNPTDAAAEACLGGMLDAKGRHAEAQDHFAAAVRLAPEHAEARVGLGAELLRQGRDGEALEQFAEAARLNPDLLEARLNLGLVLLRQHKFQEARRQFAEVLRMDPGNATARKCLSTLPKD